MNVKIIAGSLIAALLAGAGIIAVIVRKKKALPRYY